MGQGEEINISCHVGRPGPRPPVLARALGTAALALGALLFELSPTPAASQAVQQPAATQGTGKLSYTRLYTAPDGISHFSHEELTLAPVPGGQGLQANLAVSLIGDVKGVLFAQLKAGAKEDWHVAPQRLFMLCLEGVVEITAGDGEKRRLQPGQLMLLEDTTGKGHITRSVGKQDHVALAIPVPAGVPASQAGAAAPGAK
jgi:hypothetical protein